MKLTPGLRAHVKYLLQNSHSSIVDIQSQDWLAEQLGRNRHTIGTYERQLQDAGIIIGIDEGTKLNHRRIHLSPNVEELL